MLQQTAAEIAGTVSDRDESDWNEQESYPSTGRAHPTMTRRELCRFSKSLTAREIYRPNRAVKQGLWGGEFYTDGYDAATAGRRTNRRTMELCVVARAIKSPTTPTVL